MRSDLMKKGLEKAPHRSLLKAVGLTDEEIARPLVGVAIRRYFNAGGGLIPHQLRTRLGFAPRPTRLLLKALVSLGLCASAKKCKHQPRSP